MGYLNERHGMTMLGGIPDGTCTECARAHDASKPHDRDSLAYQYRFYDKHGRWPSWADAMAHCSDEMKHAWARELEQRGIDVGIVPETGYVGLTVEEGE